MVVAETNWPDACASSPAMPLDMASIPFHAGGQATFLTDVAARACSTGNTADLLADGTGRARSGMSAFGCV
jgi:hypothetical protein